MKLTGKVLVTGANGFVGNAVVEHLRSLNIDCNAAARKPAPGCIAVGNIDGKTDWSTALRGCEVVVHTAARAHQVSDDSEAVRRAFDEINIDGTLNLARQCVEHGVRRFIFLSSVKAMGENGHFSRETVCRPEDAYGRSKLAAEKGLMELAAKMGLEVVILRLPLVYGPGVKANFLMLFKLVEKGLPLPFGRVKNARSMIGLSNLVDLILHCLTHPDAAGNIYLASDGRDLSTAELIRLIGKALDVKVQLLPVPVSWMKLAAGLAGKSGIAERLFGSLTLDISPLQTELSWHPTHTVEQGLGDTARWYKNDISKSSLK